MSFKLFYRCAKRHQSKARKLETLKPNGNSYYRYTPQNTNYKRSHSKIKTKENNPKDVQYYRACFARINNFAPKRRKHKLSKFKALNAHRDKNDC